MGNRAKDEPANIFATRYIGYGCYRCRSRGAHVGVYLSKDLRSEIALD